MRRHRIHALTMCGMALILWAESHQFTCALYDIQTTYCEKMHVCTSIVTGYPSCQDINPYQCRRISCGQPGINQLCPKTCGLCSEDCTSGYFKDGSSCRKCQDAVDVQSVDYRRRCKVPCNHSNTWGADCLTPCSEGCRNQTCHRWKGHCLHNCKPGYYGPTCELYCEGCRSCGDKGDTCDSERRCLCGCRRGKRGDICQHNCPHCETCSGNYCTCQEGFRGALCSDTCKNCKSCNGTNCTCKTGFHGDACTVSCSQHCFQNLCGQDGECTRGCDVGWYGRSCDNQCESCVRNQCSLNGTCTSGCNRGWYGARCDEACDVSCVDQLCFSNGTCERCKPGFYGDRCKTRCSIRCRNQTCGRSGTCGSCRVGNFGDMCDRHCSSNCVNHTCEQTSGTCVGGCSSGWYGDTCDVNCPDRCDPRSCHRDTGSCPSCVQGFQGAHCNVSCPQYCTKCEQYAYKCLTCQHKHFGYRCENLCSPGCKGEICHHETGRCSQGCIGTFYGHFCNNSCSDHCVHSACHIGNDEDAPQCTDGCEDGWWGDYCDNTCPPHCVKCDRHRGQCLVCEATIYGENCNLTCSTSCLTSLCNMTGDCINGCESGRYGSRCTERCPHVCNTCQHDGVCLTCADGWMGEHCTEPYSLRRQTWILYAVIGVLVSGVLIMAALFIKRHAVNSVPGIYVSPVFNDLETRPDNISLGQLGESRDSDYRHYEMIQDDAYTQGAAPDEDDDSSEVSAPRNYEALRPAEDSVEYMHLASAFD